MPATSLFLALDQGTLASRALVIDAAGKLHAQGKREIGLARPAPDHVKQDGDEILASVQVAAAQAIAVPNSPPPASRCSAPARFAGTAETAACCRRY